MELNSLTSLSVYDLLKRRRAARIAYKEADAQLKQVLKGSFRALGALRESAGIKRAEFAARAQTYPEYVSQIEHGNLSLVPEDDALRILSVYMQLKDASSWSSRIT